MSSSRVDHAQSHDDGVRIRSDSNSNGESSDEATIGELVWLWNEAAIEKLIKYRIDLEYEFDGPNSESEANVEACWECISIMLNEDGFFFPASECKKKWMSLLLSWRRRGSQPGHLHYIGCGCWDYDELHEFCERKYQGYDQLDDIVIRNTNYTWDLYEVPVSSESEEEDADDVVEIGRVQARATAPQSPSPPQVTEEAASVEALEKNPTPFQNSSARNSSGNSTPCYSYDAKYEEEVRRFAMANSHQQKQQKQRRVEKQLLTTTAMSSSNQNDGQGHQGSSLGSGTVPFNGWMLLTPPRSPNLGNEVQGSSTSSAVSSDSSFHSCEQGQGRKREGKKSDPAGVAKQSRMVSVDESLLTQLVERVTGLEDRQRTEFAMLRCMTLQNALLLSGLSKSLSGFLQRTAQQVSTDRAAQQMSASGATQQMSVSGAAQQTASPTAKPTQQTADPVKRKYQKKGNNKK